MEKAHLPLVRSILAKCGLESENIALWGVDGLRDSFDTNVEKTILVCKHRVFRDVYDFEAKKQDDYRKSVYDTEMKVDLTTHWIGKPEQRIMMQVRVSSHENFTKWGIRSKAAVIGEDEVNMCEAHLFLHIYITSAEKLRSRCWMLFDWRATQFYIRNDKIETRRKNNSENPDKRFLLVKYEDLKPYAVNFDVSGFNR